MDNKYPFRCTAVVMIVISIIVFAVGFIGGYSIPKWARMIGALYMAVAGMSVAPMFDFQYPENSKNGKDKNHEN